MERVLTTNRTYINDRVQILNKVWIKIKAIATYITSFNFKELEWMVNICIYRSKVDTKYYKQSSSI